MGYLILFKEIYFQNFSFLYGNDQFYWEKFNYWFKNDVHIPNKVQMTKGTLLNFKRDAN